VLLKASFGPIRLALNPQGSYSLSARTSFGRVSSEIPFAGAAAASATRDESLSGAIGGGRCEVTLQNSNGNIEILKGSP
jgi:hypothetical protein